MLGSIDTFQSGEPFSVVGNFTMYPTATPFEQRMLTPSAEWSDLESLLLTEKLTRRSKNVILRYPTMQASTLETLVVTITQRLLKMKALVCCGTLRSGGICAYIRKECMTALPS